MEILLALYLAVFIGMIMFSIFMGKTFIKALIAYSVAAEPPVRCGGSHWSGLSEPPLYRVYSYCA